MLLERATTYKKAGPNGVMEYPNLASMFITLLLPETKTSRRRTFRCMSAVQDTSRPT